MQQQGKLQILIMPLPMKSAVMISHPIPGGSHIQKKAAMKNQQYGFMKYLPVKNNL
jgi:hypothetical protein